MLDKYLEGSPTVTERLSFSHQGKSTQKVAIRVAEAREKIGVLLHNWDMRWEKAGQTQG